MEEPFAWNDSADMLSEAISRLETGGDQLPYDPTDLPRAMGAFGLALWSAPMQVMASQALWPQQFFNVWQNAMQRAYAKDVAPAVEPAASDRRFRSDSWNEHFAFDLIKQTYLLWGRQLQGLVADAPNLDDETRMKVDFVVRQYLNAVSPSNFAFTNPDVIRKTMDSGGMNLLTGFANLMDDLSRRDGLVKHRSAPTFEIGKNIASTPGAVIFQNELMQLIQYDPSTKEVHKRPLLFIPPIVNKYYHFDLQPKSSYLKYLVDQGHTVFVISWVNPNADLAHKGLEDYLNEGPLAALDAIEAATGERTIDISSFCIGGTLTATTLAYLAAMGEADRVGKATLIATLLDFSSLGEFDVFLGERNAEAMKAHLERKGYLAADDLTRLFSVVRANDQIWGPMVTHYLLGEEAAPSDLLYWFADGARIPRDMLNEYSSQVVRGNLLREPGKITLNGTPIDLGAIETPVCIVSLKDDHVAEWRSTYKGMSLLGGDTHFILGGSGHNAGTLSTPAANKHGFWINDASPNDPEEWFTGAEKRAGSWWPHWLTWLHSDGEDMVPARKVGSGKLKPIEAAPGSYVRVRS